MVVEVDPAEELAVWEEDVEDVGVGLAFGCNKALGSKGIGTDG